MDPASGMSQESFARARKDLEVWANVVEIDRGCQAPETPWSIHLGGGYEFVVEPDRELSCRVALGKTV